MDDCGFNLDLARRVKSLDLPITWAIIPNLRYSNATADLLRADGTPFLIHVPMQAESDPDGKAGNPKFYAIGVGMSEGRIREMLEPLLDSLPGAYGINNHRGSKATADPSTMQAVMRVLAERELFFLDSSTSARSVAFRTARENGLAAAKNAYFMDNEADVVKIAARFDHIAEMARRSGSVIAICHLRPDTVAFLESLAGKSGIPGDASVSGEPGAPDVVSDEPAKKGVRLVTLPQLMEIRKGETKQ